MKEIRIKNNVKEACEIMFNLITKVNDSGNLQLDSFNKYENMGGKEIIRLSNTHETLSHKVFSLRFEKTKDNVNVQFNDYIDYIDYEFDVPADSECAMKMYNAARDVAVDKHIRILDNSVKRIIDKINNK